MLPDFQKCLSRWFFWSWRAQSRDFILSLFFWHVTWEIWNFMYVRKCTTCCHGHCTWNEFESSSRNRFGLAVCEHFKRTLLRLTFKSSKNKKRLAHWWSHSRKQWAYILLPLLPVSRISSVRSEEKRQCLSGYAETFKRANWKVISIFNLV